MLPKTETCKKIDPPKASVSGKRRARKVRFSIPKVAFRRLVEEIAAQYKSDLRFQPDGIDALQESAENLLMEHFERCAQVASLCKVDTIRKHHWCFARDGETTLLG